VSLVAVLYTLTLRQVLGRKSILVLLLFASLPIALSLVFRFGDSNAEPERWTANVLLGGLVVRAILPLVALFLGTSVLGNEIEDGTAVYLLTKPISRAQIVAAKLLASWTVTSALVLPPAMVAGWISLEGVDITILGAFAGAIVAASLAYSAVFILLSLVTNRALIAGMVYVFLWEGVISGIFTGTKIFSVRHLSLGVADLLADVPARVFEADLGGTTSAITLMVATALLSWYAIERLRRFEVREAG
jgi:ABC-2 type transport system permease protein